MDHESNLKPAPFALTPATVGSLLAAVALQGARMMHLPIEPVKLVDQPRRSANPALAKANDDISATAGSGATVARSAKESGALGQESAPATSPVRAGSNPAPANRLDLIRAVARKLQAKGTQPKGRISIGLRVPKWTITPPPPLPYEQRRQQLQRAIAHLKARGVLVTVHEREAAIRRYRVTGRTYLLLAEDVIALAVRQGMGSEAQA